MARNSFLSKLITPISLMGGLCLLGLLYWSSVLREESLTSIQQQLDSLKTQIESLKNQNFAPPSLAQTAQPTELPPNSSTIRKIQPDPKLPNLLKPDPYYTTTLPKQLGPNFQPHGTLRSASQMRPQQLHPFINFAPVPDWQSLCSITLGKLHVGKYEEYGPNLAWKMEESVDPTSGILEYRLFLRDDVSWAGLDPSWFPANVKLDPSFTKPRPVTADDLCFFLDAIFNPFLDVDLAVVMRAYFQDIDSYEALDPYTLVVRWKPMMIRSPDGKEERKTKYSAKQLTLSLRPFPSFVYKYFADGSKILKEDSAKDSYRNSSLWAQNFSVHFANNIIVSCGPWLFDGIDDHRFRLRRRSDYFSPLSALTEFQEVLFKNTTSAIWAAFQSDQVDTYNLEPSRLDDLKQFLESPTYLQQKADGNGINRLDYLARSFLYVGWNEARPLFKNRQVRRALTMAVDRDRIIKEQLNGLGISISGDFFYGSTSYDQTIAPWPYDPQEALRILEAEGWADHNGDGILDKEIDGKLVPFRFQLGYFFNSPVLKSICETICNQLKSIGIDCQLRALDQADLSAAVDNKDFDAIAMGWGLGTPPEDPKQLWDSRGAKEAGSSNFVGFINNEADELIQQLQYESDPEKRLKLYHRFHRILHEEAPYTFLFTPKTILLTRERVRNVFIPVDRQDLIPGATVTEPDPALFWLAPP